MTDRRCENRGNEIPRGRQRQTRYAGMASGFLPRALRTPYCRARLQPQITSRMRVLLDVTAGKGYNGSTFHGEMRVLTPG